MSKNMDGCSVAWKTLFCTPQNEAPQQEKLVEETPKDDTVPTKPEPKSLPTSSKCIPMTKNIIPKPKQACIDALDKIGITLYAVEGKTRWVFFKELPKGWKLLDGSKSINYLRYYFVDENQLIHAQVVGYWPETREKRLKTLWIAPPIHYKDLNHPMLQT